MMQVQKVIMKGSAGEATHSSVHSSIDTDSAGSDEEIGSAVSEQKAAVTQLLIDTFGYELSADGLSLRPPEDNPKTEMLKKALARLSGDLYSEDTHFVMELVQNADDNSYRDGVQPTLKIQLNRRAVVVFNNEVGFSQKNIVAICNIGGSTKEGQKGYIGQKGIG
jgi:hypothetical protein